MRSTVGASHRMSYVTRELLVFLLAAFAITGLASWVAGESLMYMLDQLSWAYFAGASLVVFTRLPRNKHRGS